MGDKKVSVYSNLWKISIVVLVVVFVIGMTATLVVLACKGSPVVDVDYYAHGLDYASGRDREIRGEKQGWSMETVMTEKVLEVRMRDGDGMLINGGRLTLDLAEKSVSGGSAGRYAWSNSAPLAGLERSPGLYIVALPAQPSGDRHGTLTFTGGDAMLTQRVVIFR